MKKTIIRLQAERGFTLIEVLLYVTVVSIVFGVIASLVVLLLQSRVKNEVIVEVEQQGQQVMQIMTDTIRNAEAITSPTPGNLSTTAEIDVVTPSNDPTGFSLSSGVIQMSEGGGPATDLTSSRVTASNLTFENLSPGGTEGTLKIQFTLSSSSTSPRNEYDVERTFTSTATLREQ